ncbi:MAG: DUF2892 domain-containing protein [Anaerolineaceae bacterium]|jgi:hypothetical protein
MKKNESGLERVLRVLAGLVLLGFGIFGSVSGAWQVVILAVGGLLLLTGAVGFCPLYALFKFSTRKA